MLLLSKTFSLIHKIPQDFGYRHLSFKYLNDPVDVIVISKSGEERVAKPLLFFCQGNEPEPIVKYDQKGLHSILPFDENPFLQQFHLVIIAPPFIPVIAHSNQLDKDFRYWKDADSKLPPKGFSERNYLDYYVFRNNSILKQLFKERWNRTSQLVVVGHGEGAAVATKMATLHSKVTQLIYANGNPFGKIANYLTDRQRDPSANANPAIAYWKQVVENAHEISTRGTSNKMTYSFSLPQNEQLLGLKIPVLMVYGQDNNTTTFNDLFQIEAIRQRKQNILFKSYADFDKEMAKDWMEWLGIPEIS